jgi:hypothetical protein
MEYPDGEVVEFDYNPNGVFKGLEGDSVYAMDMEYDEAGRMTQIVRDCHRWLALIPATRVPGSQMVGLDSSLCLPRRLVCRDRRWSGWIPPSA